MSLDISLHVRECEHCGEELSHVTEVCDLNVTHNLGAIASRVGIYPFLWRAPEHGIERASQLIKPLEYAIEQMETYPANYLDLQPANGWGTLEGFIMFCKALLNKAREYPHARIYTSR